MMRPSFLANSVKIPLIRMEAVRVRCRVRLTVRSTFFFCDKAFASEISGISRVDREVRKEEGKNSSGMAIPLSMPNWARESSLE